MTLFIGNQNSGLALTLVSSAHGSQLMRNLQNPSRQYSKHQTRPEELERCLDKGLEPTYYRIVSHKSEVSCCFKMWKEKPIIDKNK